MLKNVEEKKMRKVAIFMRLNLMNYSSGSKIV